MHCDKTVIYGRCDIWQKFYPSRIYEFNPRIFMLYIFRINGSIQKNIIFHIKIKTFSVIAKYYKAKYLNKSIWHTYLP